MTVAKLVSFSFPSFSGVTEIVRGLFARGTETEVELLEPVRPAAQPAVAPDQARYARMLERELDRELMSQVEREDSETLNRVRAALYAD